MHKLTQIEVGLNASNLASLKNVSEYAPAKPVAVAMPPKTRAPVVELPKVAILLCTYHGQHYLVDQLESFAAQTHTHWEIWASDDGSKDDTHAILEAYIAKWGKNRLSLHSGPAEGFVANFLSVTCKANIDADYYAYSDQDDIWEADKLERALDWLKKIPAHVPALYCSRTRLVDEANQEIGLSPLFSRTPSFRNALMQNVGGGNTMVFNNAMRSLLRDAGESVAVITHDWWAYLLATACGGKVFYDPYPSVRYRQHDANLVGMDNSWHARFVRMRMLWEGRFRQWNDGFISGLAPVMDRVTPENRAVLKLFVDARNNRLFSRLLALKRAGVYRQTVFGNLGLVLAGLFNKL
jgi:glycosyltransferase involved in cell wall biosynthesis